MWGRTKEWDHQQSYMIKYLGESTLLGHWWMSRRLRSMAVDLAFMNTQLERFPSECELSTPTYVLPINDTDSVIASYSWPIGIIESHVMHPYRTLFGKIVSLQTDMAEPFSIGALHRDQVSRSVRKQMGRYDMLLVVHSPTEEGAVMSNLLFRELVTGPTTHAKVYNSMVDIEILRTPEWEPGMILPTPPILKLMRKLRARLSGKGH